MLNVNKSLVYIHGYFVIYWKKYTHECIEIRFFITTSLPKLKSITFTGSKYHNFTYCFCMKNDQIQCYAKEPMYLRISEPLLRFQDDDDNEFGTLIPVHFVRFSRKYKICTRPFTRYVYSSIPKQEGNMLQQIISSITAICLINFN